MKKSLFAFVLMAGFVLFSSPVEAGQAANYGYCPPGTDNEMCVYVGTGMSGGVATFTINARIIDEYPAGIITHCPSVSFSVAGATSWTRTNGCNPQNRSAGGGGSTVSDLLVGAGYQASDMATFSVPYGGNPPQVCTTVSWSRSGMSGPGGTNSGSFNVCAVSSNSTLPISATGECFAPGNIPPASARVTLSIPFSPSGLTIERNSVVIATGVTSGSYTDSAPIKGLNEYTITDSFGNSGTDVADVVCGAVITVTEVGGSNGTWVITPENKTGTYNMVNPTSSGNAYNISLQSLPLNCTSYAITNTDGGGSSLFIYPTQTKGFTVTYTCPPPLVPSVTLTASPSSVTSGQSSTLNWTVSNATSCTTSNDRSNPVWSGSITPANGNKSTGALTQTTTFTLNCSNANGSAQAQATVTVSGGGVPTVTLTTTPSSVTSGQSSTLNWTVSNATSCTTSNDRSNPVWSGSITPANGNKSTGALTQTTTFTLNCSNANGSAQAQDIVSVTGSGVPTVTLTANPTTVTSGQSSTLNWTVSNATSCAASNGWSGTKNPAGGTESSGPLSSNTTFTITCTNANGSAADSATVNVNNAVPPTVVLTTTPSSVASGQQTDIFWRGNDALDCQASAVPANANWSGFKVPSGGNTMSSPLTQTTNFTLTCTNPYGTDSLTRTVTVTGSGATITVNSNLSSSWTIPSTSPTNGSGTSAAHAATPGAGGTIYNLTSVAAIPGYNYTITNSQSSGSSMTVFPGGNETFTITYSAIPSTFDYSLSNNGNVSVTKSGGTSQGQSQVTASLITGPTQPVTFTATGMPAGVSVAYANQGCSPTCTVTITFTVQSSVPAGSYPILVTATSPGVSNKTTGFNLVVSNPVGLSVTCTASPSPAYIGQPITWTANVSGGAAPFTYAWSGTNFPGTPTTNPYVFTYQTTGTKTASVTVTDSLSSTASCPATTLNIGIDPRYQEF
jgi:hypothetical protein